MKLRRGTHATFTNMVVDNFSTVFDIESDASINYFSKPNIFNEIKHTGETILVKSDSKVTEITNSIDSNNTATGWSLPSWAITSDNDAISGKYTSEQAIIDAGGKVL